MSDFTQAPNRSVSLPMDPARSGFFTVWTNVWAVRADEVQLYPALRTEISCWENLGGDEWRVSFVLCGPQSERTWRPRMAEDPRIKTGDAGEDCTK